MRNALPPVPAADFESVAQPGRKVLALNAAIPARNVRRAGNAVAAAPFRFERLSDFIVLLCRMFCYLNRRKEYRMRVAPPSLGAQAESFLLLPANRTRPTVS